ncbi:MAG: Rid family detoxifying hydrolase [Bacteroidota bacterium]
MKTLLCSFVLLLLIGCRSEEDMRKMMREEISKAAARSYFTSAQVVGPYTPAITTGGLVFISGQIGISQETGQFVGEDVESQTRQALANVLALARQAGCDSSDIVQCTVFLKNMNNFQKMNLIYGGYFAEGKYPTRSTVEVSNLPKNAEIEISAIAVRPH